MSEMVDSSNKEETRKWTPVIKSYKNSNFLNSSAARNIRIMCEYEEPHQRLRDNGVTATVLVFGSARSKSTVQYNELKSQMLAAKAALESGDQSVDSNIDHRLAKGFSQSDALASINAQLERLEAGAWMCEYYDKVHQLTRELTQWAMSVDTKLSESHRIPGVARTHSKGDIPAMSEEKPSNAEQKFMICTGGGPGFMEAANQGASEVPGAKNIGMGISLPFESHINPYVTDDLSFEFHYFFTRKFWMVYHCQALIVAPGGVGTMDELFEVLTLKQTGKIQKDLPVVLLGATYWNEIVNWQSLIKYGVVSSKEYEDLFFTDSVDEAFNFVISRLQMPEFEIGADQTLPRVL